MPSSPAVTSDRLDGWRLVDERVDTPFDIRLVTVTAATTVYEDPDLAAAVREVAGADGPGRFFLTSQVTLQPQPPTSGALRKLVADRASRDFASQLRDRGFTQVEQTDDRPFSVAGADAQLVAYEGVCPIGSLVLDVQAWLAVWEVEGDFLLAGGAYPTRVQAGGEESAASPRDDALRTQLDPTRFREDLFELVRSVRRDTDG